MLDEKSKNPKIRSCGTPRDLRNKHSTGLSQRHSHQPQVPEDVPTSLPALWELWDGTQEQKLICWNLYLCFFPSEWPRSARVSLFMRSWRCSRRHRAQAMCFSSILIQVPARHTAQNKILLIRDDYSKSVALAQPCSRSCAKWLVSKQIYSLSAE